MQPCQERFAINHERGMSQQILGSVLEILANDGWFAPRLASTSKLDRKAFGRIRDSTRVAGLAARASITGQNPSPGTQAASTVQTENDVSGGLNPSRGAKTPAGSRVLSTPTSTDIKLPAIPATTTAAALVLRFVHAQCAPPEIAAVELLYGLAHTVRRINLYKTKPARTTRLSIGNDRHRLNTSKSTEQLAQLLLRGAPRKVSNIQLLHFRLQGRLRARRTLGVSN